MTEIADKEIAHNLRWARAVRAKTMGLLEGLSQDQLDLRPAQGFSLVGEKSQWSLGEHADHILRVEGFIRIEVFEKLVEMSRHEPRPVLRLRLADVNLAPSFIPRSILERTEGLIDFNNQWMGRLTPRWLTERLIRFTAFPTSTPKPWKPTHGRLRAELHDELSKSLDILEATFVRNKEADFRKMVFVHTILGRHTLVQLARIVTIHEEWHQDRMIELLSNQSGWKA